MTELKKWIQVIGKSTDGYIWRESQFCDRIIGATSCSNLSEQFPHPAFRSVKQDRRRQGARSAVDFASINRDGELSLAMETKWYRKKDDKFLANEILRDFIRLEILHYWYRVAARLKTLFVLGGSVDLVSQIWQSAGVINLFLPSPIHHSGAASLTVDVKTLLDLPTRNGRDRYFSKTHSYFVSARMWRRNDFAGFDGQLPIPKQFAVTNIGAYLGHRNAVCAWLVTPTGPGPWETDNRLWTNSRIQLVS